MGKYAEEGEETREQFIVDGSLIEGAIRGMDIEFTSVIDDKYTISYRGDDTVIEVLNQNNVIKDIIILNKAEYKAPLGPDFNVVREKYVAERHTVEKVSKLTNIFNIVVILVVVAALVFIYTRGGLTFGH